MPRGRKASEFCCKQGDKRFCFACRREIVLCKDFFWDPNFSPHPHHTWCKERIERHRPAKISPPLPAYRPSFGPAATARHNREARISRERSQ
jgi:hypothetical protein